MQLLVADARGGHTSDDLAKRLRDLCARAEVAAVIYADTMAPHGVGMLTWSEDPAHFVRAVRPLFAHDAVSHATLRADYAMLGRTYATGHEPDLEFSLLRRAVEHVRNEAYPWHVWYPLR